MAKAWLVAQVRGSDLQATSCGGFVSEVLKWPNDNESKCNLVSNLERT